MSVVDPIRPVIVAHDDASSAYQAATEIADSLADGSPERAVANLASDYAYRILEATGRELMMVEPTTLIGVADLLLHISNCEPWQLPEDFAAIVMRSAAATIRRLIT